VSHGAAQAIQPPDKKYITTVKLAEASFESWPLVSCSRCFVGEDQVPSDAKFE